ncbi:DUF421 domain-containing protein [Lentibacillus jeotgali]|uniref:DUF421 domain-containing protein n=1 Tax=Lentibacillus jeotgali TaxID=558169 RepID=UPI0002625C5F|nr:DUF421 domain-containing protein [Lentibacillus jeotgali]
MPEYMVIAVRTLFSFFFILLMARILGKKQLAQLTFFDYITGITIGNMAAAMAIDTTLQPIDAVIGVTIFTIMTILIAKGAMRSLKFRKLVEGSPLMLMRNGNVLEKNLSKANLTFDDLMMGLREKNVFKLSDVETAVLETSGTISVMKKTEYNPLTPKDINLSVESEHEPSLIIVDGVLLSKRLKYLGYSEEWLLGEVMKQGGSGFKDVFLGQIDTKGNVYADLYDETKKTQQVKQKPQLASQLRKIQAELESLAIQTDDKTAKQMYYNQSIELQNLIDTINPFLKE